ncbi:MAG: hypothetical protein ACR2GY_01795 [Phycisphaerales bacterium]
MIHATASTHSGTHSEESRSHAAARAREHTHSARSQAERIVELASHLDPADRDLIDSIYRRGMTVAALARASGVRRRRLNDRLTRVLKHLQSREFRFAISQTELWPRNRAAVAKEVIFKRKSLRAAASQTGLSLWQVRKELDAIRTLCNQARDMGRLPA